MDYSLDDWKMLLAACALLMCMIWDTALDIAKDYVRVPKWITSNIFVLNALTILILGNIDIEKGNVLSPSDKNYLDVLVHNQLRMDVARLTLCVFVGCILPGMAMEGAEGRWSSLAALFVSLSFHIGTEIYALHNANNSILEREAVPCQLVQHLCKIDEKAVLRNDEYLRYESMLEDLKIFSNEELQIFWKVNKKSFDRIKRSLDGVNKSEEICTKLLSIVRNVRLAENERFRLHDRKKNFWIRALSKIFEAIAKATIGVYMEDAIEAYRETRDVLNFVDCRENVVLDGLA
ncbi:hypothetical protein SUGI_0212500 [Cryptomeria japonica]|nr:hypothetical protein SUGI_0212500 [Cryptomeria japonica]